MRKDRSAIRCAEKELAHQEKGQNRPKVIGTENPYCCITFKDSTIEFPGFANVQ
jgi:hypothetical protein